MKSVEKITIFILTCILVTSCGYRGNSSKEAAIKVPPVPTESPVSPTTLIPTSVAIETRDVVPLLITSTATDEIPESRIGTRYIIAEDERGLLLWDLTAGVYHVIDHNTLAFHRSEAEGCEVLITDFNGDLLRKDILGNTMDTLLSHKKLNQLHPEETVDYEAFLSPDGLWAAYWVGSGEPKSQLGKPFQMEVQDVYSVPLFSQEEVTYKVSRNGGAWKLAWSPKNEGLAYSDFDENHVLQVFFSSSEGQDRRQISQFQDPETTINKIVWSPEGTHLAIQVSNQGRTEVFYGSTAGLRKLETQVDQPTFLSWWTDEEHLIYHTNLPGMSQFHLAEVSQESKETSIILEAWHTSIFYAGPFDSPEEFAFFTPEDLVIYNLRDSSYTIFRDVAIHFTSIAVHWYVVPDNFPGIRSCE